MGSTKGKAPSVQWYYGDWLRDTKLQMATPSSRGIWMNVLMYMVDCERDATRCTPGELTLTIDRLCRLGHCTQQEAGQFIDEGLELRFCDIIVHPQEGQSVTSGVTGNAQVTPCNAPVTIRCRRLYRAGLKRAKGAERKARYDARKQAQKEGSQAAEPPGNEKVTPPSSSSTPVTNKNPSLRSGQKAPSRKKPARPIPEDIDQDPRLVEYALNKGMTQEQAVVELEKFVNHAHANDRRQVDWYASWRTWVLRAAEYAPARNNNRGGHNGSGFTQPRTRGERNKAAAYRYVEVASRGGSHPDRGGADQDRHYLEARPGRIAD